MGQLNDRIPDLPEQLRTDVYNVLLAFDVYDPSYTQALVDEIEASYLTQEQARYCTAVAQFGKACSLVAAHKSLTPELQAKYRLNEEAQFYLNEARLGLKRG